MIIGFYSLLVLELDNFPSFNCDRFAFDGLNILLESKNILLPINTGFEANFECIIMHIFLEC